MDKSISPYLRPIPVEEINDFGMSMEERIRILEIIFNEGLKIGDEEAGKIYEYWCEFADGTFSSDQASYHLNYLYSELRSEKINQILNDQ